MNRGGGRVFLFFSSVISLFGRAVNKKKTGSGACYAFTDYLSLITDTLVFFIASHGVFFLYLSLCYYGIRRFRRPGPIDFFSIKKNKLPSNHVT